MRSGPWLYFHFPFKTPHHSAPEEDPPILPDTKYCSDIHDMNAVTTVTLALPKWDSGNNNR